MHPESSPARDAVGAASSVEPPAISVVMTTFNAERFVAASVGAILRQDHPSFELVVYDDGSTDGTVGYLEGIADPRLRLAGVGRIGRAAALNAAVRASRGDLVAVNDADDLSLPYRLTLAHGVLEHNLDAVLVGTRVQVSQHFTGRSLTLSSGPTLPSGSARPVPRVDLYRRNPFVHSTVVFRRSAWSAVGGYDESLSMCVDYDLFLRMAALGRLLMLPQVTLEHYVHADSYFKRRPGHEYLAVLQRIRRRARAGLGIPLWARVFDLAPYLQAARAGLLRQ